MAIIKSLSFNDVMLVPKRNSVSSRAEIDLSSNIGTLELGVPIIASNMSSVCGPKMCVAMHNVGALGILHRMCTIDEQMEMMCEIPNDVNFGISFGIGKEWINRIRLIERFNNKSRTIIACLDVAHAHSDKVMDIIDEYYRKFPYNLIIGNIATVRAACDIYSIIPKDRIMSTALKCGIGGGCFTSDTNIFTITGNKRIMDIVIGDFVLSHSGKFEMVIDTLRRSETECLYNINQTKCTKNHEFFVLHKKYEHIITDNNLEDFAEWVSAEKLNDDYLLIERCENYKYGMGDESLIPYGKNKS